MKSVKRIGFIVIIIGTYFYGISTQETSPNLWETNGDQAWIPVIIIGVVLLIAFRILMGILDWLIN